MFGGHHHHHHLVQDLEIAAAGAVLGGGMGMSMGSTQEVIVNQPGYGGGQEVIIEQQRGLFGTRTEEVVINNGNPGFGGGFQQGFF